MNEEMVMALVLALLHSLWQGLAIMIILSVVLRKCKNTHNLRYGLSLAALITIVMAATITFSIVKQGQEPLYGRQSVAAYMANGQEQTSINAPAEFEDSVALQAEQEITAAAKPKLENTVNEPQKQRYIKFNWEYVVLYCWAGGAACMLGRIFLMLAGTKMLVGKSHLVESSKVNDVFKQLLIAGKFGKRVTIAISGQVVSPCIAGVLRPVILLPECVTGLSVEEITAILSHELAHIRRYDWLVNIFQMLIEAILFFNPFVWWISRQIRLEREAACDQYAISAFDNRHSYAELLVRFAAMANGLQTSVAVGFSNDKKSSLMERVKLLLVPGYRPGIKTGIIPILIAGIVGSVLIITLSKGTDKTIEFIGSNLSQQQRQEIAVKAAQDNSLVKLTEDKYITMKGKIVTEDGGELPWYDCGKCEKKHLHLHTNIYYEYSPSGGEMSWPKLNDDGTFEVKLTGTKGWFSVEPRSDYAEKYIPFEFEPGEVVDDFVVTLEKGFYLPFKIVDQSGNPVVSAKVSGGYPRPPHFNSWRHSLLAKSGEDGVAIIENYITQKTNFNITAEGYEKLELNRVSYEPGASPEIILKKVPSTAVTVVDSISGEPVQGARVLLHGGQYYQIDNRGYYEEKDCLVTDDKGMVELKSISPSVETLGLVKAGGYQRQYFEVVSGEELKVELGPVKPIKGVITGNLDALPSDIDGKYMNLRERISVGNSYHSDVTHKLYITEKDGKGYFELNDYYGQEIRLSGGPIHQDIVVEGQPPLCEYKREVTPDLENIVVALPEGELKDVITVKLTMRSTEGEILKDLNGKVMCRYTPVEKTYDDFNRVDIVNGIVEFEAKNFHTISYMPDRESGYFFGQKYYNSDKVTDDITNDVICFPAGSIIGEIKDSLGNAKTMDVSVVAVKEATDLAKYDLKNLSYESLNGTGYGTFNNSKFVISPLPLGGIYYIYLYNGNTVWISDGIKLTRKNSVCKLDIKLPELVTVKGRITYDNGEPYASSKYRLGVVTDGKNHSMGANITDSNGEFIFEGINPDLDRVEYYVRLPKQKGILLDQEFPLKKLNKYHEFKVARAFSMTCKLIDSENGRPLSNVGVGISLIRSKKNSLYIGNFTTDTDGKFYFDLEDGTAYKVHVTGASFRSGNDFTADKAKPYQEVKVTLRK